MSQLDLADALEVSRQSVSKWETGAAVPELDKLVKMSTLFGITLDQLVGRASSGPTAPKPSTENWFSKLTPRKFVSGMFFFGAFLFHLYSRMDNLVLIELLYTLPLVICGFVSLFCKSHPALWCTWVLAFPYLCVPFEQIMRPDFAVMMELLLKVPLLIISVFSFRKETLELTKQRLWFLGIGWSACILWFAVRLARLHGAPVLFEGITLGYMLDVLNFPLFTALLTITIQVWKHKGGTK